MSIWFTLETSLDNNLPLAFVARENPAIASNGVGQNGTDLDRIEHLRIHSASCTIGIQFLETG
jgi:hypothetical protein